ncbi:MAG: hypothetical protein L0220_10405 [Acidobacteria bacterium]|nr:hypothetical protein [Acidobacteriota bacterium]
MSAFAIFIILISICAGLLSLGFIIYQAMSSQRTLKKFNESYVRISQSTSQSFDQEELAVNLSDVLGTFTLVEYSHNPQLKKQVDALLKDISEKVNNFAKPATTYPLARFTSDNRQPKQPAPPFIEEPDGAETPEVLERLAKHISEKKHAVTNGFPVDERDELESHHAQNPVSVATLRRLHQYHIPIMINLLKIARKEDVEYRGSECTRNLLEAIYRKNAIPSQTYKILTAALKIMDGDKSYVEEYEGQMALKLAAGAIRLIGMPDDDFRPAAASRETQYLLDRVQASQREELKVFIKKFSQRRIPGPVDAYLEDDDGYYKIAQKPVSENTLHEVYRFYPTLMINLLRISRDGGIEYRGRDSIESLAQKLSNENAISPLTASFLFNSVRIVSSAEIAPKFVEDDELRMAKRLADAALDGLD